jgi:hypothetical protein
MILILAVAIGASLLRGLTGFMGTGAASALAAAASPLAPAIDDCAEAGALQSREQNNAEKRIFMQTSTALPFRGEEARSLSWALAGNFVRRQNSRHRVAHRVALAMSEYWKRRGRG